MTITTRMVGEHLRLSNCADFGYATTWATNAEAALATLGTEVDEFDAVFSDVVMLGMGGLALACELRRRRRRPNVPLLLTSGYSHVLASEANHGFALLQKPYSADEIARTLRRIIQGGISTGSGA